LVRNTQKLRAVEFTFDDENIDCNINFGIIPSETPGITVDIENDAVCDMPPAPQITVITLYMVQSNKDCQIAVTNTSSPESRYCYQLYTSDIVQTSSTQFTPDLTKDYIYGHYDSQTGEWRDSSSKHDVSDMPSTTGSTITLIQMLSDGKLWLGSNISVGSVTFNNFSVALFRVADNL
jgi:hypothetical protein